MPLASSDLSTFSGFLDEIEPGIAVAAALAASLRSFVRVELAPTVTTVAAVSALLSDTLGSAAGCCVAATVSLPPMGGSGFKSHGALAPVSAGLEAPAPGCTARACFDSRASSPGVTLAAQPCARKFSSRGHCKPEMGKCEKRSHNANFVQILSHAARLPRTMLVSYCCKGADADAAVEVKRGLKVQRLQKVLEPNCQALAQICKDDEGAVWKCSFSREGS